MVKSNPQKDPSKWSEITYIRCDLDDALKVNLKDWLKGKHDWFGYIEKEVDSGLRFGAHHDSYNSCFEARLTALAKSVGVNTLVLQGRGPDLMSAMQALFFKHYVVLECQWEDLDRENSGRFSTWG